jgi:imidazolonepropionase-like amidohydrolase
MKTFPHILLALAAVLTAACASTRPVTAIVGATVIDPRQEGEAAVMHDQTIVIEGNRIAEVGATESVRVPGGATLINARGKYVVPGLIDAHVHFFQSGNLYTRPDAADFNAYMPYAKEVARNQARLPATFKVWLASGVTGVVDIGGPFWNFDMRDAAARSEAAPRVAVAGPLISMVDRVKLDLGDPPIIKIASPEEARALVKRELARKPDYIKVWYIHQKGDDLAAQEAIVKATADAAHEAGVPLAVHATELLVAKSALKVGADFLVHSVEDAPVDEEFIALAKRNHAIYCPTLFVGMGYRYALSGTWKPTEAELRLADPEILAAMGDLAKIPKEQIPERVAGLMAKPPVVKASDIALANLRRVWDAGIPVAMGTDAGNVGTLHGPSVFREMDLMTQAGLTPLQVLRSATVNGALAMRRGRDLGVVERGRLADLVIVDADPLARLQNLSETWRVVKDGRVYDPQELMRSVGRR